MTGWSDNFDDSPEPPNREDKKFDQERSSEFDNHVERLIIEFQDRGAYVLLRWLEVSLGDKEAHDTLQEGVTRLWANRHKLLTPHSTVQDVKRLLWTICKNIVYDRNRRGKKFIWLPLKLTKQNDEEDTIQEEIEKEWLRERGVDEVETTVCQAIHDRDVMKAVLQHFKKKEDLLCLGFMILGMKPHEMVGSVPGSADSIRKRCGRIRQRLLEILRKMDNTPREFDPNGG